MKKKVKPYPILGEESENDLMLVAEAGIPYGNFNKIAAEIPVSMLDWASFLHLSERTLHRYKKNKLKFDPLHSERIIELYLLFKKGQKIFGSEENYFSWLNSKNIALGGKIPKALLKSSIGINLVKDELSRIEHGILA